MLYNKRYIAAQIHHFSAELIFVDSKDDDGHDKTTNETVLSMS